MSEFNSYILSTGETYLTHFDGAKGNTFSYAEETITFNSETSFTSQLAALETVFNYFDNLK